MRKCLFLIIIIFAVIVSACNNKNTKNTISKPEIDNDSTIVERLNQLSWKASATNFEKAKMFADSALQISKRIGYEDGIGKSYSRIALAYDYKGSYDTAFVFFDKAIKVLNQTNNKSELAKVYNNIGASYYVRAKYVDAISYYQKSLTIREELDDKKGIGQSLNNMGLLYRIQKNYPKAIEYYKKSIEIRTLVNDSTGILYAEQNLAVVFEKIEQYDSALYHYNKAIHFSKMLNDSVSLGANLTNACILNKNNDNFELAIEQAEQAEQILRKTNEKHALAYSIASYADLYLNSQQLNKALKYATEGLQLSKELNFPDLMQSCYSVIANTYAQLGDYQSAYKYNKLYASTKDSTLNIRSSEQLKELQTKYETEKKEQEIEKLTAEKEIEKLKTQKQRLITSILGFLVLFIVGLSLIINRQNRLKRKRREEELKHRLFRSQMNPHFIFNALASIQNYIYTNEPDEAAAYLSNFSALMRDILEGSATECIPVEQELNIVSNYCKLQKMRKNDIFDYVIENNIDGEYVLPPMLAQPFIENATIHAYKGVQYKGLITIRYYVKNHLFYIEVEDNGIGYAPEKSHSDSHKSVAIELTQKRIALLNTKKQKASMEIHSINDNENTGTIVRIKIPLENCLKF
jgi:tetratricopeptide (TPR) repeat protein